MIQRKLFFAFILLIGLIPYRIFGLLGLAPLHKLGLGALFLLFFCFVLKEIVPLFLNSYLVQTFFFYCLWFEEYLYRVSLPLALLIAFGIPFQVVLAASHSEDPFFWYSLMLLLYNLYYHLKRIFLNPAFEGSIYRELGSIPADQTLTWGDVVLNMSVISKGLFKVTVENHLGKPMSQQGFPLIAKRYVFTNMMNALKGKSEVIAATAVVSGLGTAAVGEYRITTRHDQTLAAMERQGEAQLEAARIQAEAARTEAEAKMTIAQEMKRANDLKEKELLLLQRPSTTLVSGDADVSNFFAKVSSFFFG